MLRSAYYEGYGYGLLDRWYLICSSTIMLFITLLIERGARGRLLRTMITLDNIYKFYRTRGHRKVVLNHISVNFQPPATLRSWA